MEKIEIKSFDELGLRELYDMLALRTDVFVVEQECAYPELDYHDQASKHLLCSNGRKLVGYARIAPAGSVYKELSIGRVAVCKSERGKGLGRKIFDGALRYARQHNPESRIKIQAQCYLENFYQSFGFQTISKPYPDFGVMHVDMIIKIETRNL